MCNGNLLYHGSVPITGNGAFAAKPGTNCKLFVTCREMLGKPARGIYNESKEARRAVTQGGRLPILL